MHSGAAAHLNKTSKRLPRSSKVSRKWQRARQDSSSLFGHSDARKLGSNINSICAAGFPVVPKIASRTLTTIERANKQALKKSIKNLY